MNNPGLCRFNVLSKSYRVGTCLEIGLDRLDFELTDSALYTTR